MEEFRDITLDCGVTVTVSSYGRILKNGAEMNIRQFPTGYCYITVKSKEHYLIHKLVASAFIQTLKRGDRSLHVHHIDGDKTNNRVENLQVLTMKEHQQLHKTIYPKIKECVVCGKLFEPNPTKRKRAQACSPECRRKLCSIRAESRERKIDQYSADGKLLKTWKSARDIQNELGIYESNINKCCNGHIRTYKGYVWKYSE